MRLPTSSWIPVVVSVGKFSEAHVQVLGYVDLGSVEYRGVAGSGSFSFPRLCHPGGLVADGKEHGMLAWKFHSVGTYLFLARTHGCHGDDALCNICFRSTSGYRFCRRRRDRVVSRGHFMFLLSLPRRARRPQTSCGTARWRG